MSNPINNTVFDSRDLIDYREELQNDILEAYVEWAENHNDHVVEEQGEDELEIPDSYDEIEFIDEEAFTSTCEDLIKEHEEINDFIEEIGSEARYGITVIHENYFVEYCRELCEELGEIPRDLPGYIENNINWQGVADDLEVDYSSANYDGDTYYFRM